MSREYHFYIVAMAPKNLVKKFLAAIWGMHCLSYEKEFKDRCGDVVVPVDVIWYRGCSSMGVVPDETGISDQKREIWSECVEISFKLRDFIEEALELQEFGVIGAQLLESVFY